MIYNINRFHLIVLVTWQFSLFFIAQLIFPIFLNYIPKWRCGSEGAMGFDCAAYSTCNGTVEYEDIAFHSAAVEFEWFCGDRYYATLSTQLQFLGVSLGTIAFGPISDVFGRKPLSITFFILGIISIFCTGFASNARMFSIARFFVGLTGGGTAVTTYTLINELLLPEQRMALRGLVNWGFSRLVLTVVCMFMADWRWSSFVMSLLVLPALFSVIFLLPESPTWLHFKGRTEDMIMSEKAIARKAGIPYEPQVHRKIGKPKGLFEIFHKKEMFRRLIVLWVMWFTASTCSYANDLNSNTLSGNFYVNQILFSVLIYFSKLFLLAMDTHCSWLTRRLLHQFSQSGVVICFLVLAFMTVTDYRGSGSLLFSLLGTVLIEYTWDACALCAVESMETNSRASGTGTCSFMARLGSLFAPMLAHLNLIYPGSVYIAVVGLGTICLVVSMGMLVETKGVVLDDVDLDDEEKKELETEQLTKC